MDDNKISYQNRANDEPIEADGPVKKEPESDDSNEEDLLNSKVIPSKNHPHNEEITVYNTMASFEDLAK